MIGIVTALHIESRPLIDYYHLKKDLSPGSQPLFRGEDLILIESGIGKVRSAAAAATLMHQPESPRALLNMGLCGAVTEKHQISALLVANRIIDHSSKRNFFPDILWPHGFDEAAVETFDRPVTRAESADCSVDLVDMEAAGFFEAAALYLSPDRIFCLKLVSDRLSPFDVSRADATRALNANLENIVGCIGKFLDFTHQAAGHCEALSARFEEIGKRLKLTAAQKRILRNRRAACQAPEEALISGLDAFLESLRNAPPDSKKAAKLCFETLLNSLGSGS